MKYLFILGRNSELSKEEVRAFMEKEENKILFEKKEKNALFLETKNPIKKEVVDFLGGTISIGEVLEEGTWKELFTKLDKKQIYLGESNKLNYLIWNFSEDNSYNQISDYLKARFRSEKLKATEKHASGFIKTQEGEEVRNLRSPNVEEEFFIFGDKNKIYFGKIIQKCDYEKIELRDTKKPVRRPELSISPRLAKILINLSQVKQDETLLDPFCGIGVILQESLLQNISVVGIDRDKKAIDGCKQNLIWFNFDKNKYKILNSDSTKINLAEKFSGIATEPDLGTILKKTPTPNEAKKTLEDFEDLMIKVINNFKKNLKPNSKIVFTSPLIRLHTGKRISCNGERISNATGIKIAPGFPIDEFREGQIVGRQIFVLNR
ncbi:tRNA (guanine(10)-N2)-dimethyltransferase [uncultured archaeon]|nr:tRNA (guanine(10)-N2)-dimethyltransferase [uncultured archaeon]